MITRIVAIVLLLTPLALADWQNALRPAGTPAPAVTVVKDGQRTAAITIPPYPTTEEQKAADDLQQWITQMTGATLKITAKAPGPVISIATNKDFADEEYEIAYDAGSNSIRLTGGPGRGVINAVY